jgi:uncharacterized protein YbjT (DUF2867 family)
MADRKIIAVVGATGAQGGGVARAILADKDSKFAVRAITRDADSEAAQALRDAGAEVVEADIDDVESLTRAFAGAYGAYCVTFYWSHFSPEKENAQAANMAKAAKAAGVEHVIWSTLEDTRNLIAVNDDSMPTLMGKYKVPHFDGKGESDHVFTDLGVPTTFLLASYYWENLIANGPKRGADGALTLTLPIGKAKMAGVAASDIGEVAYGIFKRGKSMIGQRVGVAGEQLTASEIARALSKALGEPVRLNAVTPEVYRTFGFPGADDLGNMFQFYRDFADECNATRDVERTRSFAPGLQSFEQWLQRHASELQIEAPAGR